MISQYWVGQIPDRPMSIQIQDNEGSPVDLSVYTTYTFRMLGSRNEEVSLSGHSVVLTKLNEGKITFIWPTDRSLFERTGDYVLQLELGGTGKLDFTSTHTIRVRELGRTFR
jgi:hypothetical protein